MIGFTDFNSVDKLTNGITLFNSGPSDIGLLYKLLIINQFELVFINEIAFYIISLSILG
jgi:hypothetical protein